MVDLKRARFTEAQILRILKKAESADDLRELCREQNITLRTLERWQTARGERTAPSEPQARLSRTERTREVKIVNQLGHQLVAYPPSVLDELELPEELRHAIDVCQAMKPRTRGRQRRLVCQILRGEEHEAIRERVESLEQSSHRADK
jgi:ribosomal 50S subunit-associated protein YjgA (DUF615 family)